MLDDRDMDAAFQALANENRRRMLDTVKECPGIGVGALANGFDVSRIAVMKHLNVLEKSRLVSFREGRANPQTVLQRGAHSDDPRALDDRVQRVLERQRDAAQIPRRDPRTQRCQEEEKERPIVKNEKYAERGVYRVVINAAVDVVWSELVSTHAPRPFFWNSNWDTDAMAAGNAYRVLSSDGQGRRRRRRDLGNGSAAPHDHHLPAHVTR